MSARDPTIRGGGTGAGGGAEDQEEDEEIETEDGKIVLDDEPTDDPDSTRDTGDRQTRPPDTEPEPEPEPEPSPGSRPEADADPTATTNVTRGELLETDRVKQFLSKTGLLAKDVVFDIRSGIGGTVKEFGVRPTEEVSEQRTRLRRAAARPGPRTSPTGTQFIGGEGDGPALTTGSIGINVNELQNQQRQARAEAEADFSRAIRGLGVPDFLAREQAEAREEARAQAQREFEAEETSKLTELVGDVEQGQIPIFTDITGILGPQFDVPGEGATVEDLGAQRDFGDFFGGRKVTLPDIQLEPGPLAGEFEGSQFIGAGLSFEPGDPEAAPTVDDVLAGATGMLLRDEPDVPDPEAQREPTPGPGAAPRPRVPFEQGTGAQRGVVGGATFAASAPAVLPGGAGGIVNLFDLSEEVFRESVEGDTERLEEIGTGLEQTAINVGAVGASRFLEDPEAGTGRIIGSLIGTGGLFAGARAIGPRTSLATRTIIQPGEEALGIGGHAVTRRVAGKGTAQRLFPHKEPLIFSEEAAIRAGRRGVAGARRRLGFESDTDAGVRGLGFRSAEVESGRFDVSAEAETSVLTDIADTIQAEFTGEDRGQVSVGLPAKRRERATRPEISGGDIAPPRPGRRPPTSEVTPGRGRGPSGPRDRLSRSGGEPLEGGLGFRSLETELGSELEFGQRVFETALDTEQFGLLEFAAAEQRPQLSAEQRPELEQPQVELGFEQEVESRADTDIDTELDLELEMEFEQETEARTELFLETEQELEAEVELELEHEFEFEVDQRPRTQRRRKPDPLFGEIFAERQFTADVGSVRGILGFGEAEEEIGFSGETTFGGDTELFDSLGFGGDSDFSFEV